MGLNSILTFVLMLATMLMLGVSCYGSFNLGNMKATKDQAWVVRVEIALTLAMIFTLAVL